MTALLPQIRAHGADATIRRGAPVLVNATRLPAALVEECRARRADLLAEIEPQITVACATCGAPGVFVAITNPEQWQCAKCLPDTSIPPREEVA